MWLLKLNDDMENDSISMYVGNEGKSGYKLLKIEVTAERLAPIPSGVTLSFHNKNMR